MAQTVGMKLALEGEAQYKAGLQQIQQKSKELAAEMKAVVSAGEGEEKQMEVLGRQIDNQKNLIDQLTTKYDKQKAEIENTKKAIEDAKSAYGENSAEVQKLETQLIKQETALSKTKTQINNEETALNQMEKAEEDAAKDADTLGDETKEAGEQAKSAGDGGFTVMKGVLANLATDAIKSAVDGLKNLASGIKEAVSETVSYGDEVDKQSQKLGLSAENYQKLSYAMANSGADIESFKKGMLNINSALANFSDEGEDAESIYSKLGVSMKKSDGSMKKSEDVLLEVVDALAGMEDETQRDAAAQEIFGKSMTELRPLLNSGSEGIKALMQEAEEYGMVMSDDAVKASADFDDSMSRLNGSVQGLKHSMVAEFLPSLGQVVDGFSKMVAGVDGGQEDLAKGVQSMITSITQKIPEFLAVGKEILVSMIQGVTENLPDLIEAVTGAIPDLFGALADVLVSIDIGQLVTSVFDCINSIIKAIVPRLPELLFQLIEGIITALPELFIGVGETIVSIFDSLFGGYTQFDEFKDKVDQQSKAWDGVTSAMQAATDQANNDAVTWSNSWEMLKNMTDSTGKVKEGYEGMAAALVDQLNGALGLNIEIIDGQIQDYQSLCSEIDNLIEKKRAELILQAEEEAYAEALRMRPELLAAAAEAEANYTAAQEELNAAQMEYNGLVESGGDLTMATNRLDKARIAVSNMSDALDEATKNVEENTALQSKYMDDYTKVMNGDYNELGRTSKKYTGDTARDLIAHRKTIESQLDQDKQNYDAWVRDYQTSLSEHSKAQADYYAKRIAEDKAQIANINGIIKQGGKDFTQGYINGILENESGVDEAGRSVSNKAINAVKNTQQSESPAKVTKGLGNDFSEGYKLGIEEKGETVKASAEGVADKAVTGIGSKKAKAKTAGTDLGGEFVSGIKTKETAANTAGEGVAGEAATGLGSKSVEAKTAGTTAGGEFAGGITSKEPSAKSAGQGLAGSAVTGASAENGNVPGQGFYGVGENAAAGFAAGIGDKGYLVENAAYATAYAAKKKMEATLEIASPSKVFKRIGAFVSEGFAIGIESESDMVMNTVEGLADSVAGTEFSLNGVQYSNATRAIGGIVGGGSSVYNRNNTVNITVNAAEGMNENVLADLVINKLQMEIIGSEAVYA